MPGLNKKQKVEIYSSVSSAGQRTYMSMSSSLVFLLREHFQFLSLAFLLKHFFFCWNISCVKMSLLRRSVRWFRRSLCRNKPSRINIYIYIYIYISAGREIVTTQKNRIAHKNRHECLGLLNNWDEWNRIFRNVGNYEIMWNVNLI